MKVTEYTRWALAVRRQKRTLESAGYRRSEPDWEIVRGFRHREVITDVRIGADGKSVWVKTGVPGQHCNG